MDKILVAAGGAGQLEWALSVQVDAPTKDKEYWSGQELVFTASDVVAARATLRWPLEFPSVLVRDEKRLKTAAEISDEIKSASDGRLEAARAEVIRRFSKIELDWRAKEGFFGLRTPFGGAAGKTASWIRIDFRQLLDPAAKNEAQALLECAFVGSATADFRLDIGAGSQSINAKADIAAVVALRYELPHLRFELPEMDFGLPEFELPSLDLPRITTALAWPKAPTAKFGALERLFAQAGVTVTVKPDGGKTPALLLTDVETKVPRWAIVDAADTTELVPFDIEVKVGGTKLFSVDNFKAGYQGQTLELSGTITTTQSIALPDGGQDLGPLRLSWSGVAVTTTVTQPVAGKSGPTLTAQVSFATLKLAVRAEPESALTLNGEVEISPQGMRVVTLNVEIDGELYPLLFDAAKAIGGGVWRLLASWEPNSAGIPGADALKKLLEILSRIAAAAARAVGFAGKAPGDLLVGIARSIGKVFEAFASLAALAAENLVFDIRLRLDPLEVLQVVLTARRHTPRTKPVTVSVGGLRIELAATWQPGLLLDFVSQPGAYLVALPVDPSKHEIGSLATDLWLANESSTSAVRDADAKTGNREGDQPLIRLALAAKQQPTVMLAGLHRGKAVFLRELSGATTTAQLGGLQVTVVGDKLTMRPLTDADLVPPYVEVQEQRILALLGLGDTGKDPAPSAGGFLADLQQVIWIEKLAEKEFDHRKLEMTATIGVRFAGLSTTVDVELELSLEDLSVRIGSGTTELELRGKPIHDKEALGLFWYVIPQVLKVGQKPTDDIGLFLLSFNGPTTTLSLHPDAKMEVRYPDLSADGRGLVFDVDHDHFSVHRGGLDLDATVRPDAVRLNGLDVPFRFTSGSLRLRGGRLSGATVAGKGKLPPDLVGDAGASIALTFTERDGRIELQSGTAQIDKSGEPIACHATRFTLTITHLGLDFVRENNALHFYFLVTGTLQFTPKEGEFTDGLLKYLKDVRMNLEKVPLAGDGRVLARHINFQVALKPKLRVNLFELFSFELRGIGFHPSSPKFDGMPALNVSGQIAFAEVGDVMQPRIDFHGLWIAPPSTGESLPRIRADGLGVDIALPGTAHLTGTVLAVDEKLPTLEGTEFAPPDYKAYGFLGEGRVEIEGLATLAASFGFLEIVYRDDNSGELQRKKTFFLFVQQEKVAIEVPTPVWTLYMREVGFGFGYRYTLEGIKAAENASSTAELIRVLDDVSRRQGDLARFAAWRPDPEKDNVTLALRGAMQFAPAERTFDRKKEAEAPNPFFFDLVAALRSDMTFLMAVRGWPFTNYVDFLDDKENLRQRPLLRGYLFISAPRRELLARFISDPDGYVGANPKAYEQLTAALKAVQFSSTLYIRPGLFHQELGWPDQLRVRLFNEPNFRADMRGGMIFRIWDSAVLTGYNIEAEAFLRIGGGGGGDSLGVAVDASLSAAFAARFLAHLDFTSKQYLFYGLARLDACLTLTVRAWLRVDLLFRKLEIKLEFGYSIQLSVALELALGDAGFGALADVRVAISVFGATLPVRVGFELGSGLEEARRRVQRFMAMSITAGAPEPTRLEAASLQELALAERAAAAQKEAAAPVVEKPVPENPKTGDVIAHAALGADEMPPTDFWMVLRRMHPKSSPLPDEPEVVLMTLVPRDGRFYAGGSKIVWHHLRRNGKPLTIKRVNKDRNFEDFTIPDYAACQVATAQGRLDVGSWPDSNGEETVDLQAMMDACFLIDAKVVEGKDRIEISRRAEPRNAQRFAPAERIANQDPRAVVAALKALQQGFNAEVAGEGEVVTSVRDARTTLLAHFLEQFKAVAEAGKAPELPTEPGKATALHFADLGLLFATTPEDAVTLADGLEVRKSDVEECDENGNKKWGRVTLLNSPENWFERSDPVLARPPDLSPAKVALEGIQLFWDLELQWQPQARKLGDTTADLDPDHFLEHYEITRVLEGAEHKGRRFVVKPVANPGSRRASDQAVVLRKTLLQFTDDLADVDADLRRALLPRGGPDAALTAAIDWLNVIGDKREVTVTYKVTPVDVAGTHGTERAIVVDIRRPQGAVRPALAQLVVVAPREPLAAARALGDESVPPDLKVYFGVSDPHWDGPNKRGATGPEHEAGGGIAAHHPPTVPAIEWNAEVERPGEYRLRRGYDLFLEPDDIVPSGSFGADGLTTRLRTPGGEGEILPSADQVRLWRKRIAPVPSAVPKGIATKEDLAQYPLWCDLESFFGADGKPIGAALAAHFWRRGGDDRKRVALRAYLETVVEVIRQDGGINPLPLRSRRVPVEIELRVPGTSVQPPLSQRPASFEWPVRVDYPPLGPQRVRARAGLLTFLGPKSERISIGTKFEHTTYLDPERRSLTEVAWAAAADKGPAQLIRGFDVFELDLDELAPSDIELDEEDQPISLAKSKSAWRRARRVARAHLERRSVAMLTPGGIGDPTAWQAHMPSEVWRAERTRPTAAAARRRGSLPIRKPWLSRRESLPDWPRIVPRRLLLTAIDERLIERLLVHGEPKSVTVTLMQEDTPLKLTLAELFLHRSESSSLNLRTGLKFAGDEKTRLVIEAASGAGLTANSLRRALLCLCLDSCKPHDLTGARLELVATTPLIRQPITFDAGANRSIPGEEETVELHAQASVELQADGMLHPLLAEVRHLLSWSWPPMDKPSESVVYRRFEVVVEPPPPLDVKSLAQFLDATAATKDTYGWMALGALGLATSFKLFDADCGEFVAPEELVERVRLCFRDALARYRESEAGESDTLGAPLLEIFLRPGGDRYAADLDRGREPKRELELNDVGLAFVQVSLRPRPRQSSSYAYLKVTLHEIEKGELLFKVLTNAAIGGVAIHRLADQTTVTIMPREEGVIAPLERGKAIELLLRVPNRWSCERVQRHLLVKSGAHTFPAKSVLKLDCALYADPREAYECADLDSVYESIGFADLDTSVVADIIRRDVRENCPCPERESFSALATRLARVPGVTVPKTWCDPTTPLERAELLDFLTVYVEWMRRFLDHSLAPWQESGYALCAPVRQQPWRLAASLDGAVRLSFAHEDRYAHARAYAVRPVGRYHELAVAMRGESERAEMEALIAKNAETVDVGCAIAVSPRTARLETPTFLGSRSVLEKEGNRDRVTDWEVVVARHPEQDLVLSNRALMGRLAFEGTAFAWAQDYPDAMWPAALATSKGHSDQQLVPDYALMPAARRPVRDDLDVASRLDDTALKEVAGEYPSLWKGAEILRIPRLPHHLRATMLATARAGVVVSGIGHVSHRDFQFTLPSGLEKRWARAQGKTGSVIETEVEEPTWGLERADGEPRLWVRWSALTYADLMDQRTFDRFAASGRDVAHWPDPGVAYVLSRVSADRVGKEIVEDEAEVLAVVPPREEKEANKVVNLLALRARGPTWGPAATRAEIFNAPRYGSEEPRFFLRAHLKPLSFTSRALELDDALVNADWAAFEKTEASKFVVLALASDRKSATMRLESLPTDQVLGELEELKDETSMKLAARFRGLVRDAVLDGALEWRLRAEKEGAAPQWRVVGSAWYEKKEEQPS